MPVHGVGEHLQCLGGILIAATAITVTTARNAYQCKPLNLPHVNRCYTITITITITIAVRTVDGEGVDPAGCTPCITATTSNSRRRGGGGHNQG